MHESFQKEESAYFFSCCAQCALVTTWLQADKQCVQRQRKRQQAHKQRYYKFRRVQHQRKLTFILIIIITHLRSGIDKSVWKKDRSTDWWDNIVCGKWAETVSALQCVLTSQKRDAGVSNLSCPIKIPPTQ